MPFKDGNFLCHHFVNLTADSLESSLALASATRVNTLQITGQACASSRNFINIVVQRTLPKPISYKVTFQFQFLLYVIII